MDMINIKSLSQRLSMSYCDHLPPVVSLSVHTLNEFSFETPGQMTFKFHLEPSFNERLNNLFQIVMVHQSRWPPSPYIVKNT